MVIWRLDDMMVAARTCVLGLALAGLVGGCGGGSDPGGHGQQVRWQQSLDAAGQGWLLSVSGTASDVYAVGGAPQRGRLWRLDGSGWSEEEVPEGVPLLNWMHTFADGTHIVAGDHGTILRPQHGVWHRVDTPTDQDLWGVWGASPDDVWAVGGNGRDADAATVLHFVGGAWQVVPLPHMERPGVRAFYKVWGTGADNVYMVGQNGAVLHWDGAKLREELVGTSRDLISLWGTSADNIVMVGGRSNGVLVRWDGQKWRSFSLAPLPGVNGVWLESAKRGWISGNSGTIARVKLPADAAEPPSVSAVETGTRLEMHAVFGVGAGSVYSVGGNFQQPQGPYDGIALQRIDAGGEQ